MPRTVLLCACLAASGCWFDASYSGGTLTCADGVCPSGQTCHAAVCVADGSGSGSAIDAAVRDAPDARPDAAATHALTCSDPGPIAAAGATVAGSTAARDNHVTALCAGVVHNGADAVYAIALPAAAQVRVAITGDAALDAYVIEPCAPAPATPACLGNGAAIDGDPLLLTVGSAATYYIVVDSEQAAASGSYSVVVSRP